MTVADNLTAIRIASYLERHNFDISELEECDIHWWKRFADIIGETAPTPTQIARIITVLKSSAAVATPSASEWSAPRQDSPAADPFAGLDVNVNYTGHTSL